MEDSGGFNHDGKRHVSGDPREGGMREGKDPRVKVFKEFCSRYPGGIEGRKGRQG